LHLLIAKCLAHDESGWDDFWQLFDHYAAQAVRAIVRRFGMGAQEADDVAQDLFVHLIEEDYRRLRSFRGTTDEELHAWLTKVACNFTRDWLDKQLRAIRRERQTVAESDRPNRSGPTEHELENLIRELADDRDCQRLRILAGLDTEKPVERIPERTRQRWAKHLREKLGGG
jgi:RNA polymerase sigma factor (sigma-70 family)